MSTQIDQEYRQYKENLKDLNSIQIPRWISLTDDSEIELHGYSDASLKAYGACIYLKVNNKGTSKCFLLAAKSRIASLKQVSIPRLELCAAVLLCRLMETVSPHFNIQSNNIHAWSDSQIVLAWLQKEPHTWKTFVAQRVDLICKTIPNSQWHYVRSENNPADLISRGCSVNSLTKSPIWWHGPPDLLTTHSYPTSSPDTQENEKTILKEKKKEVVSLFVGNKQIILGAPAQVQNVIPFPTNFLKKYSSLSKAIRILGWILRFIYKAQRKSNENSNYLTIHDYNLAKRLLIKTTQEKSFPEEIKGLKKTNSINKNSSLYSLNPFLDENNILRVGGRLQHADISYNQKHQIILPYGNIYTILLIEEMHRESLHGGVTLTHSNIRMEYWIPKGKNAVKHIILNCVTCARHKAKLTTQLMGQLPAARVNATRVFNNIGVDFAGPILLKDTHGRGTRSYKGYISLFICMATKAIHIELVTSLSSVAFIAALKRFIGRRGIPSRIFSDNGTNFVGTNSILIDKKLHYFNTSKGIEWHFIPPSSPHFGGLWEAGVKATKHHLKRQLGSAILTHEEMNTVLIQIEACLNSRPLCSLSDSDSSCDVLTPGHFLIGQALLTPSDPNLLERRLNTLSRWQICTRQVQEFWNKWQKEYINQLQVRSKWRSQNDKFTIGKIVIIKTELIPPGQWPLGRIVEIHPGADGLTRVVTLQTKSGKLVRPIAKLALLPVEIDTEQIANDTQLIEENSNSQKTEQAGPNIIAPTKLLRRSPRFIKHVNLVVIIAVSFLVCLCAGNSTNSEFKGLQRGQAGLYFRSLGNVNQISDEWNIISSFNMTTLNDSVTKTNALYLQLNQICTLNASAANDVSCAASMPLLEMHINELIERKKGITQGSPKHRRKREFVTAAVVTLATGAAVGTIGTVLYKNSEFNDELKSNREKTEILIELNKKHVKFLDEINEREKNQYIKIATTINQIEEKLNNVTMRQENNQQVFSIINELLLAISTINQITTNILNAITLKRATFIMTASQLQSHLQILKKHLSNDTTIPEFSSYVTMLNALKIECQYESDSIKFKTTIPIINKNVLRLYRVIVVPILDNGRMLWTAPDYNYLASNANSTFSVSDDIYHACIKLETNYICKLDEKQHGSCERHVFLNKSNDCPQHYTKASAKLIQVEVNRIMYVLPKPINVTEKCESKSVIKELKGIGMIDVSNSCTVWYDKEIILASPHNVFENIASIIPVFDFSNKSYSYDEIEKLDVNLTTYDESKLKLKEMLNTANLTYHDVHHYMWTYVIIIVVIIILWKLYKISNINQADHSQYFH